MDVNENNPVELNTSKVALLNKLSFWILLAVTALIPVFFLPISFISTQFGSSLLFSFGVIVSAVLYIISGIVNGSLDLPKPAKYILGFSALVPVVYFLSGIYLGFSRMAFFGYTFDISTVGFIVLAFVYMFLVSVLFKDRKKILYSYYAFSLSALVFALFILVRIFSEGEALSFGLFTTSTATMLGSWNNIAVLFGMTAILSLLTLEMVRVSKAVKALLYLGLLVSLFFMALVNFTLIWGTLAVCTFTFLLYGMFNSNMYLSYGLSWKEKLSKVSFLPLIVFVVALVFVFWGTAGVYLAGKLNVSNIEVRPSLSTTLDIAKNTIKSKPLFGSGPNTFVTQWLTYKPSDIVSSVFWNTDFTNGIGLIPTFTVTTGILGLLSWLLFLGFYIYLGIKSIFVRTEDLVARYLVNSSFFVSLFLWIIAFGYVPSTAVFVLTFFFTGLFFASIYSASIVPVVNRQFNLNPRLGFVSSLIMVASLVAVVSLGYGLFKSSLSLWYYQKSSFALNTNKDSKASEEYMLKAIVAVPNDIYYRSLSEIQIFKLNEVLSQDPKIVKQEDIQKQFTDGLTNAITAAKTATERDDSNYLNWVSLGRVYDAVSIPQLNITGAYESAQLAYIEALKRNPKNPGMLMLLARLSVNRNDLKQAEAYAGQAIQIKNNYLDAYFLLSQIEVANGNISGAVRSVTAASVIDPTNPAIFFQLGLLKYNQGDFKGAIEALEKATTMTPDYANAKFFLGLSYEVTKEHEKALKQFEDLAVSNPDSQEVKQILENLRAGKAIFTDATAKPEKGKDLPIKENL
ncbi:MAG: Tfp pilus assembly protein PilF [Parcubacteria group bacterium Gr01-1014_46]|nr:MAG: Tfp pilus assembly protein PilF [Parcubacteria group bacterium Gr01-1014_46]